MKRRENNINSLELNPNILAKRKFIFGFRLVMLFSALISLANVFLWFSSRVYWLSGLFVAITILQLYLFFDEMKIKGWLK